MASVARRAELGCRYHPQAKALCIVETGRKRSDATCKVDERRPWESTAAHIPLSACKGCVLAPGWLALACMPSPTHCRVREPNNATRDVDRDPLQAIVGYQPFRVDDFQLVSVVLHAAFRISRNVELVQVWVTNRTAPLPWNGPKSHVLNPAR